jgi:mycothiol system anti-sigma-R factor
MTTDMKCDECCETLDAFIDGELLDGEANRIRDHLAECGDCAAEHRMLSRVSSLVRTEAGRPSAPDVLKARIRSELAKPAAVASLAGSRSFATWKLVAAGLIIAILSGGGAYSAARRPAPASVAEDVLSSHIRSLMPGHLTDVASTNLHNVKPWFNGRIDLSPVVPSLDSAGFPLVGGRLDYVNGRTVAVVVYARRQHLINVFAWPSAAGPSPPSTSTTKGYHLVRWVDAGVEHWAASDLGVVELSQFVSLFRRE